MYDIGAKLAQMVEVSVFIRVKVESDGSGRVGSDGSGRTGRIGRFGRV